MQAELAEDSAEFDTLHYCPHKPESRCSCRKPGPGLAYAAIEQLGVAAENTCIIGDTYADAITGLSAGCRYAIVIPSTRDMGSYDDLPIVFRENTFNYPSFNEATKAILASVKNF